MYIGYSKNITKYYKVYLLERGYIIIISRVIIKKSIKGGTINLRI